MENVHENDIVLCTVDKIDGTTVFVKLEDGSSGTIVTSEIAPGRIRNIREYVSPNKKIVCKVMRISQNHVDLSLRRVTGKERDEVMETFKQEQTAKTALKSLLKEKALEVTEKILKDFKSLSEFFTNAKEDEKLVDKYIPKEAVEQIKKLTQKKKKEIEVKKIIKMKCLDSDGLKRIREIFTSPDKAIEITYIAAGNYQINIKDEDYKKANQKMNDFTSGIEQKAKKSFCDFSIEDKK
jgi:translation initiation factor 2 alpha subunit (eIF-2alpha)